MKAQPKSLNEITREAIELLSREMGVANTLRFLNQFTTGYGNYTEEREKLFADVALDDILTAVKQSRSE